jgi:hypothetical protein
MTNYWKNYIFYGNLMLFYNISSCARNLKVHTKWILIDAEFLLFSSDQEKDIFILTLMPVYKKPKPITILSRPNSIFIDLLTKFQDEILIFLFVEGF